MIQQKERQPDARKEDEERRGEEEDGNAEEAGRAEKRSPDHTPAAEDARHVDREAGAIARPLAIVPLHLASQMAQNEGPRRHDEEAEEADAVGEPVAEDGAGDEVEQGEDDDLLVVRGA